MIWKALIFGIIAFVVGYVAGRLKPPESKRWKDE